MGLLRSLVPALPPVLVDGQRLAVQVHLPQAAAGELQNAEAGQLRVLPVGAERDLVVVDGLRFIEHQRVGARKWLREVLFAVDDLDLVVAELEVFEVSGELPGQGDGPDLVV